MSLASENLFDPCAGPAVGRRGRPCQAFATKSSGSRRKLPLARADTITRVRHQILIVDDDAVVQELLTLFLGSAYEVGHATTAARALVQVGSESVDLVVLDHRLPDRTGLDLLIELRSIRPSLPVVMLTGYGSEWICAKAFKLGVTDYFPKPVSAVDFVTVVRRILSRGAEKAEAPRGALAHSGPPTPLSIPVQKAMGLIQQRYWDHLTLSLVAREVGMSKCRLSHRFREVLGVTFRDYLLQVRLDRAKRLLVDGHAYITEVAQMVGFGDLPRFDKLFKRNMGVSPSAYRSVARARGNK